jgi:hypothetical protein
VPAGSPPRLLGVLGTDLGGQFRLHQLSHHPQPDGHAHRQQPLAGSRGHIAHRQAQLVRQLTQLSSEIPLDQANSRYLLHGGPLPSGVLADARHLPHGRSQAGDRHLNFNERGDNLQCVATFSLAGGRSPYRR